MSGFVKSKHLSTTHRGTLNHRLKRFAASCAAFLFALLLAACSNPGDTTPGGGGSGGDIGPAAYTTTVIGTVQDKSTKVPLPGAAVSSSTATTTTGPDGRFRLQVTHLGSFTFTAAKTCFETSPVRSIIAAGTGLHNSGLIELDTLSEPKDDARFTLTQNPGTSTNPTYTLTLKCVRTVTEGEFAASNAPSSRLVGKLGTNPRKSVTAIELPVTLRKIENRAFQNHDVVTGEFTIPAAVESIGSSAFTSIGKDGQVRLRFAQDSRLKTIGDMAFASAGISAMPPLPQSLETVGLRAFEDAFTPDAGPSLSNFVIPENVKSVGDSAFGSAVFSGTLTIRSPHLKRTPALDPPNASGVKTGRLGNSIFTKAFTDVTQEFTRIVMPRDVFTSYTQMDLTEILGPLNLGVTYKDLKDGKTLSIITLQPR